MAGDRFDDCQQQTCESRGYRRLLGCRLFTPIGAVARQGEQRVHNAKVGRSILPGSTNSPLIGRIDDDRYTF